MRKQSLRDVDVGGKRVFVRVDFNVPLDEIPRNRARTRLADRSQQPYLRALGGGMTLAQRLDPDHVRVAVAQPAQRIPGPRVSQAVRPTVRGIVLDHVELERHLLDPVERAVEVADVGREDRGARPLAGAREERSAQARRRDDES